MHAFMDKYAVLVAAAVLRGNRWFSQSVETEGFEKHIKGTKLLLPEITGEGFYEAPARAEGCTLDPAFHVAQWLGPEYPTVIYHHGNNESPFDYRWVGKNSFKRIFFTHRASYEANLIALRAAFHNQGLNFYIQKLRALDNWVGLLSAAVLLEEALVQYLKNRSKSKVIIVGISLGGWVANLHRSFFDTADTYIPILAGAALDDVFTESYYNRLVGSLARENRAVIENALNFEKRFADVHTPNVFPLLARFDQYIRFDRQKVSYAQETVSVLAKGHVSGSLAFRDIRAHIAQYM